jgi:hypothetical protein
MRDAGRRNGAGLIAPCYVFFFRPWRGLGAYRAACSSASSSATVGRLPRRLAGRAGPACGAGNEMPPSAALMQKPAEGRKEAETGRPRYCGRGRRS